MDIKEIFQAFIQFLTDFFAALGKFLGTDIVFEEGEETEESETPAEG